MHPVADTQDRRPHLEHHLIDDTGVFVINRLMTAGEDDAIGFEAEDLLHRDVKGVDLAVGPRLPHPPGYELGVLRAEIKYQDPLVMNMGGHACISLIYCY